MSQKHIEQYPYTTLSGPGQWQESETTPFALTHQHASAFLHHRGCTAHLLMQVQIFFTLMGSAHWQNGLMTIYSSGFSSNIYPDTTVNTPNITPISQCKDKERMVAGYGMVAPPSQTEPSMNTQRLPIPLS